MKRYDYNFLDSFCKENNITLIKDYSKDNLTMRSKILLKCIKSDCKLNIELLFQTLVKNKDKLFCKKCKNIKTKNKKEFLILTF